MPSRRHVFPGLALACTSRERLAAIDLRASGREGLPWRLTEATNGASGGIAGGPSTQAPFASRRQRVAPFPSNTQLEQAA